MSRSNLSRNRTERKITRKGKSVYMLFFYNLASAFDTVELSVLLEKLFRQELVKLDWPPIKALHRLTRHLSGVSSLSTLFNLVLDPLLLHSKKVVKRLASYWLVLAYFMLYV